MKEILIHVFAPFRYFKIETIDQNLSGSWDQITAHIFLLHCLKKKSTKIQLN